MIRRDLRVKLGSILIIISIFLFLSLPLIPLLKIDSKNKIVISTVTLILAEILFWSGGFLVGKELFKKYKSYFIPKNWFKNKK